jgi:NADPH-dependent 2,4-dienoyl-CoA reductase/sulfur reductase-like enzyme/rhodanese-related sulfurtransferase
MSIKLVIVGGVAGGASAATRARRLSESAQILLFERGPVVSFANCGLPYYIGGEIASRDKLLVASPLLFMRRYRLDVRVRHQVERIEPDAKIVVARDLARNETYVESFDKLILATGAEPARPGIDGMDDKAVFTLRTIEDSERIKAAVDGGAKCAVVIGAGFIGLELVESLVRRGVSVTLVEDRDQVLLPLDREMSRPVLDELRTRGVDVRLRETVESITRSAEGLALRLKSGGSVGADLVVVGVGVRPESGLAKGAGLELGARGGVKVNAHMQTSNPDIYAVGDSVETNFFGTGAAVQVPLAGPASRQGRIAADHAFGRPSRFRGTQGTVIVRVFGVTAAVTGQTERMLAGTGQTYRVAYVHPTHHAGYYPGASIMTIKLVFEPKSGKLLGAQIVGGEGVDKRIDVLSLAIQGGMTVFDLEEAELGYAPQFGSAKDPINMAGFVAANIARGDVAQATAADLDGLLQADPPVFLLDVRTFEEFSKGAIPGSINAPIDELRLHIEELPRDRPILAYCQAGQRGYVAARLLRQHGFRVANLAGGYRAYRMTKET